MTPGRSLAVQVAWKTGDSTGGGVSFAVPTDRFDDQVAGFHSWSASK